MEGSKSVRWRRWELNPWSMKAQGVGEDEGRGVGERKTRTELEDWKGGFR